MCITKMVKSFFSLIGGWVLKPNSSSNLQKYHRSFLENKIAILKS